MAWDVALAVGVALFVGVALSAGVAWRGRSRTRRIREGTAELARGNLGHRIILPGEDDAAKIAVDVNALADAFQRERETAGARDAAQRQLLANISHDLRTPITSIAGYVDALQRGLGDDPGRYLGVIASKTEDLAQLTDDLFYEARLDAGDLDLTRVRFDLAETVRRSVLGFEPQLTGRGLHVSVDVPETTCEVQGDPSAVARILGNLLSNALRHGEAMTELSVVLADEGECYAVRLTNDGADLPADIERLFERGVAGRGGGAGLGLAIARELAARMGATVGATKSGSGRATFSVIFPKPE